MIPAFLVARRAFHAGLVETILTTDANGIPSIADKSQKTSCEISAGILKRLATARSADRLPGQHLGNTFEAHCEQFLRACFPKLDHLRPGKWEIARVASRRRNVIADYEQYHHLDELESAAKNDETLAASLGNDYTIAPDILVVRHPEPDEAINRPRLLVDETIALRASLRQRVSPMPLVHASVSCKWTLRSDRAQNARSEALNLIRNRKGRCPHICVVIAEPSPSRLASIALGTGDIDCVYHFALPELVDSVNELQNPEEPSQMLRIMIEGKRLKDIGDLPLDLAV